MANQWQKIRDRNANKLLKVATGSFIAATQSVSFKSPVRDGFFKNSWFTEINGISDKYFATAEKSGQTRLTEALNISKALKIGDSISFVSNSPYGNRLEYEAWSDQAPNGMIRVTAAQWPLIVKQVARGIK